MKNFRSPLTALLLAFAMVIGFLSAAAPADAVVTTGTIIPSPSPTFSGNTLWSVSCVSSTWCMSAGMSISDNVFIKFDGGTASEVTNPNSETYAKVFGVSCVSDTQCIAVGFQNSDGPMATQILSFDGAAWTLVQSPNFGSGDNSLISVSCASSTSCVAVGYYNSGTQPYSAASQTLAMTWDGANWTTVNPPNTGSGFNRLNSVSCTSSTSCVAVGFYNSGIEEYSNDSQTLAMTWDGANWTTVNPPNTGSGDNELNSVSCTSSTSCIAVGDYSDGSNLQTLALKWNGSSWTSIGAPAGTGDSSLRAVSCVSSNMCVAVGESLTESDLIPLMATWDGTNWTAFAAPTSPEGGGYSYGISCSSENSCLVAGQVGWPSQNLLIELTETAAPTTTTTVSEEPLAPSFTG